jgi:cytochrome bd-type quinol oxidase subunit 1
VALWKKFWLLFSVMWIVVAGLHVATILAFSDEVEHGRAAWSAMFAVLVPAVAYLIGWIWEKIGDSYRTPRKPS